MAEYYSSINYSSTVLLVANLGSNKPVPAGINLPTIMFSFNPFKLSVLPLIVASVNTLVVSWKLAALSHESTSLFALVIPNIIGLALAPVLPLIKAVLFALLSSSKETFCPGIKLVSPGSSTITLANNDLIIIR